MLTDPRVFPASADPIVDLARRSLTAEIPVHQQKLDEELRGALRAALLADDGDTLEAAIERAPAPDVGRHVWRRLAEVFATVEGEVLVTRTFAIPVVLVAGAKKEATVPCLLTDRDAVTEILLGHGALGGNKNFTVANGLSSPLNLEMARMPELYRWQSAPRRDGDTSPQPAAIELRPPHEAVHLRFLFGAAIAGARADLFGMGEVGPWGVPLAREISRQLSIPEVTLLALPRAPMSPVLALHLGRTAQREISLQIFVSNALREFRGSTGEPVAVLSAHRGGEAANGGELRLSLSSPFDPLERGSAQGFRCPLFPLDRLSDVERSITTLLADCRVTDVRVRGEIFPDRDPATGQPLFVRPETEIAGLALH
jgi:hypothetical protein